MPSWHNSALKSATCPLWSRVLRLTEASCLVPDSLQMSPGNETEKQSSRAGSYSTLVMTQSTYKTR